MKILKAIMVIVLIAAGLNPATAALNDDQKDELTAFTENLNAAEKEVIAAEDGKTISDDKQKKTINNLIDAKEAFDPDGEYANDASDGEEKKIKQYYSDTDDLLTRAIDQWPETAKELGLIEDTPAEEEVVEETSTEETQNGSEYVTRAELEQAITNACANCDGSDGSFMPTADDEATETETGEHKLTPAEEAQQAMERAKENLQKPSYNTGQDDYSSSEPTLTVVVVNNNYINLNEIRQKVEDEESLTNEEMEALLASDNRADRSAIRDGIDFKFLPGGQVYSRPHAYIGGIWEYYSDEPTWNYRFVN